LSGASRATSLAATPGWERELGVDDTDWQSNDTPTGVWTGESAALRCYCWKCSSGPEHKAVFFNGHLETYSNCGTSDPVDGGRHWWHGVSEWLRVDSSKFDRGDSDPTPDNWSTTDSIEWKDPDAIEAERETDREDDYGIADPWWTEDWTPRPERVYDPEAIISTKSEVYRQKLADQGQALKDNLARVNQSRDKLEKQIARLKDGKKIQRVEKQLQLLATRAARLETQLDVTRRKYRSYLNQGCPWLEQDAEEKAELAAWHKLLELHDELERLGDRVEPEASSQDGKPEIITQWVGDYTVTYPQLDARGQVQWLEHFESGHQITRDRGRTQPVTQRTVVTAEDRLQQIAEELNSTPGLKQQLGATAWGWLRQEWKTVKQEVKLQRAVQLVHDSHPAVDWQDARLLADAILPEDNSYNGDFERHLERLKKLRRSIDTLTEWLGDSLIMDDSARAKIQAALRHNKRVLYGLEHPESVDHKEPLQKPSTDLTWTLEALAFAEEHDTRGLVGLAGEIFPYIRELRQKLRATKKQVQDMPMELRLLHQALATVS
jgi:hypothetical protein